MNMNSLPETDRLIIRNWNPDTEAEQAFQIYRDPEVSRFLGAPDESVEARREKLRQRNQKHRDLNEGSGYWAMEEKNTGELLGTIILQRLPDGAGNLTPEWEVGWHLKKSAWGKGYATEAGKTAIDYGFAVLKLPIIYAVVKPENHASIRVTQRLGMTPKGRTDRYYGTDLELFELRSPHLTH
jgi:RimJ/RimL family protein N-acetyltransferase